LKVEVQIENFVLKKQLVNFLVFLVVEQTLAEQKQGGTVIVCQIEQFVSEEDGIMKNEVVDAIKN